MTRFCQEVKGGVTWKFIKNEAKEGFGEFMNKFEIELNLLDHVEKFEHDVNNLRLKGSKWRKRVVYKDIEMNTEEMLRKLLRNWWWKFMRKIDRNILNKLAAEISIRRTRELR